MSAEALDPMEIARFMVMDGAARVVRAFGGIPEGELREASIRQLEAMCSTYSAAPPQHRMPDPVQRIAPDPVKALEGPRRGVPKTGDPAVKAVQMMLDGTPPAVAARETGLTPHEVKAAKLAAKRGGITFPDLKASKKPVGMVAFPVAAEHVDMRGLTVMTRAATKRGITVEVYFERRKTALEMALAGRHVREIMEATQEDKTTLTSWFVTMRSAGYPVPYMLDSTPGEEPSNVIPIQRAKKKAKKKKVHAPQPIVLTWEEFEALDPSRQASQLRAARMMGVELEDLLLLRREVIAACSADVCKSAADIVAELGGRVTESQVTHWRDQAQKTGLLPTPGAQASTIRGAKLMGVSVEEYERLRDEALARIDAGETAAEVARSMGLDGQKVANWNTWATPERRRKYGR